MDSAYLLDQLPGAAIGQLMRTAIQEQPQRVEKNTGGRVATFLVRPPLSYKVDSSLPDNQILVDRRTLARLEATSQKCDELERTGQHYQRQPRLLLRPRHPWWRWQWRWKRRRRRKRHRRQKWRR